MNFIDPTNYSKQDFKTTFTRSRERGAQFIVVFIHWGPNWVWYPSDSIVQFGHSFIDAGADVMFGHGAHNYQVVSLVQTKFIFVYFTTPDLSVMELCPICCQRFLLLICSSDHTSQP